MRWAFFDDGGYVALCKRYRLYAKQTGLLKTLAEKRAANPNVDRLVGAVNTWCWDRDAVTICREMVRRASTAFSGATRPTPKRCGG